MLTYDPTPWLMAQEGLPALRARRRLGLNRKGDAVAVRELEDSLAAEQRADGSFAGSPMRTAGTLNLLDDLRATDSQAIIARGGHYLPVPPSSPLKIQPAEFGHVVGIQPHPAVADINTIGAGLPMDVGDTQGVEQMGFGKGHGPHFGDILQNGR